MFDLTKLRSRNVDQLHTWGLYTLARPTRSVDGVLHPEGAEFMFDYGIANVFTRDAMLYFTVNDQEVVFDTRAGEYRELFVPTGLEGRPSRREPTAPPEDLQPVDESQWLEWLAARPEYQRAAAILKGLHTDNHWSAARDEADVLRRASNRLEAIQPAMSRWLADQSLNAYHAWMSQATSGGEGAAMEYQVRDDLKELRKRLGQ